MLEAADNYVRDVDEARSVLFSTATAQVSGSFWRHSTSELGGKYRREAEEARVAADAKVREVLAHLPRIRLLFEPGSRPTKYAEEATEKAQDAMLAIYDFLTAYEDEADSEESDILDPEPPSRDYTDDDRTRLLDAIREHEDDLTAALNEFSKAARRAISGRW